MKKMEEFLFRYYAGLVVLGLLGISFFFFAAGWAAEKIASAYVWWSSPLELLFCGGAIALLLQLTLLLMARRAILGRRSDAGNATASAEAKGFYSDEPIRCVTEDALNRGAFVSMLQNLLEALPVSKRAGFVGLYAPWGEGKTSVVNLLKERVLTDVDSRNPVLVIKDFSPWKYQNQEELPLTFFRFLARALKDQRGRFDGHLDEVCKKVASALSFKYMERKVGCIDSIVDFVRSSWMEAFYRDELIMDAFQEALGRAGARIVVVIDDVDRLPDEDVCRVIRFFKAHGDLPGIIYLIVADEARLVEAVSSLFEKGKDAGPEVGSRYLEKMIPISRQLPVISGAALMREFERQLNEMIDSYWPDGIDKSHLDCDMVRPFLTNLRSLKRMANAVRVDLAFAKKRAGGYSYFGVDVGDFVLLSILREFEKAFYLNLPSAYEELGNETLGILNDRMVTRDWMDRKFFAHSSPLGKSVVERFVFERLGIEKIVQRKGDGQHVEMFKLRSQDVPEDVLGYRLSSKLCFSGYFISEFENVQVSQNLLLEFLESVKNNEYPAEVVGKLDTEAALPFALYAQEALPVFDSDVTSRYYIWTLVHMGESPLRNVPMPSQIGESYFTSVDNICHRVFRCLLRYCLKVQGRRATAIPMTEYKPLVGDDTLYPILKDEHSIVMAARFIGWQRSKKPTDNAANDSGSLFSEETFKALTLDFLDCIAVRQGEQGICSHVDFFSLFRSWVRLLDADPSLDRIKAFQQANDRWLGDYGALSRILVFFADDRRQDMDDTHAVAVNWPKMTRFWTEEQIQKIFKTLVTTKDLEDKDELFLFCLDYILLKRRACDCDFAFEVQQNYVKREYGKLHTLRMDQWNV